MSGAPNVLKKTCARCMLPWPVEAFNRCKKSDDGRQAYCCNCHKIYHALIRAPKIQEKRAEAEKARRTRGPHVRRNTPNLPSPPETAPDLSFVAGGVITPEVLDEEGVEKKAGIAVRVATSMFTDGTSARAIEDQALALMHLPTSELSEMEVRMMCEGRNENDALNESASAFLKEAYAVQEAKTTPQSEALDDGTPHSFDELANAVAAYRKYGIKADPKANPEIEAFADALTNAVAILRKGYGR